MQNAENELSFSEAESGKDKSINMSMITYLI